MPVFEVEAGGKTYEVEASDIAAAAKALQGFGGAQSRTIEATPAPATFDQRFAGDQTQNRPAMAPAMEAQAQAQGAPTRLGSFGRGAVSGMTMNFADEAAAGVNAAYDYLSGNAPEGFGQSYEGWKKVADQVLGSDQLVNPGSTIAGNIAGGIAAAPVLPSASGIAGAVGAGKTAAALASPVAGATATSALYGALYGAGEGNSLEERSRGAVGGALIGGALGNVVGRVLPGVAGAVPPPPNPGQVVTQAAENIGVQLPRAVATDSVLAQRAASSLRNIPGAGDPLQKASEKAIGQLGEATEGVAASYGGASIPQAGAAVRDGIAVGWNGRMSQTLDNLYGKVDSLVNPTTQVPLSATQKVAADITSARRAQRISDDGSAVNFIAEAIADPAGLTYEGVKGLRTRVGEMLKDKNALASQGVNARELERVYAGLSDDLRNTVQTAGGPDALQAFQRANGIAAQVAKRRESLERVVGATNAEGIVARLQAAATAKGSRADIQLLGQARKAAGADAWDDLSGAVVSRLGRDDTGAFSPARFLTDYGKISPEAKALLFNSTGKGDLARSLDDIATVSGRFKDLQKFANPSGTAQNLGGAGIAAGLVANPVMTIGSVFGGNVLARIMSQPATASSMARWSNAYANHVAKPTASTISQLNIATRNFGNTISDKLGIPQAANDIYGMLSGPARSAAGENSAPAPDGSRRDVQ